MIYRFISSSIVFICLALPVRGLRCYTCSYDERDAIENRACVTEPWNLTGNPIRSCLSHVNFCIIVRIEVKDSGRVSSFLRKCEENPMEDADMDSATVVAHYRSCTLDLCNKGDGLNYIDEGYEGDSAALLVPDKRSSSTVASSSFSRILQPVVLFLCFSRTR